MNSGLPFFLFWLGLVMGNALYSIFKIVIAKDKNSLSKFLDWTFISGITLLLTYFLVIKNHYVLVH